MAAYCPKRGDIIWISFNPQAGHEQAGQVPLTTKLLGWLAAWSVVLGLFGFVQGSISSFNILAMYDPGAAAGSFLARSFTQTLYSTLSACAVALYCLLCLLPCLIVLHIRKSQFS